MAEAANALLSVRGLVRGFSGVRALQGLDFDVWPNTVTALVGPSGAGKTTAFQCISGVVPVESGHVVFRGQDVTGWPPEKISRAGLVGTFQATRAIPRLSVLENLLLYAPDHPGERMWTALLGGGRVAEREVLARARSIARRLELSGVANQPAGALSGDQKKLLEIGRALMTEPKLVLLDEPSLGANPSFAERIGRQLESLRQDGVTFLVTAQQLDLVAQYYDPVIVMAEGRTLKTGRFAEVAADGAVQAAYLGRTR